MRPLTAAPLLRAASAACLITLAFAVAGCGKSPTAPVAEQPPPPPTTPEWTDVTVTFESVLAIADGDGIEGAGDFVFQVKAEDGVDSYEYHTSTTTLVRLNAGETLALNKSKTFRIRTLSHSPIEFVVVATEWDQNILGQAFPDSDLDNALKRVAVPDDERYFNVGLIKTQLGNSNCKVEFRVRVTSKPVE